MASGELSKNSELKTQGNVSTKLSTGLSRLKRLGSSVLGRPALVAGLIVTGLLLGGRQLRLLEPLELSTFDWLMQLRPALPPDPRLLVVTVTEEDIQSQDKYPLTDAVINQLLARLEQYQPAVIGLDIYRDLPVPPGHAELSTRLSKSDRIIPVCKVTNGGNPGTPPPPSVPESRVGFSDIAVDRPNGIVRRALLFLTLAPSATSGCNTSLSFSFQLAQHYLAKKGIKPELTPEQYLKIGKVVFKPLLPTDGGYQHGDTGGYQILLNYRSGTSLARQVTLTDVLNNRIDPNWVKDRIVLIGVTAPSVDDSFYTPYSSAQELIQKMPGVVVHGQIVSQLLSAVLDGRPLFWFWSEWGEVLWILGWSLTGGILVRVARHPIQLVIAESVALGLLFGISAVLFLESGWVPVVAPSLGLIATGTVVLGYSLYEARKEQSDFVKKVQEQEQNIALLQALLKEKPANLPPIETDGALTEETEMPPDDDDDDESTTLWPSDKVGNGSTARVSSYRESSRESREGANLLAGRYKIKRVLGSGGFGLTYLAEDSQRPGAPQCVVKHLRPARRDEKFLQVARRLFRTEAEILEKLGNHPQIPQLLAYFEENQEFYLVQEYIQGHSLTEELPVDKRVPEAQVVDLLKGLLEIMVFIHKNSVIHRDIKPTNIIRRQADGKVVLIDFGAVKQIQPQDQNDQEGATVAIGTRGYAPPEQYAGHPSFSSDIYALGVIGIQALTGITPHQLPVSLETGDINWRHLANVSEEFGQILEKMVRYHFVERYQSVAVVLKELEGLNQ
jgi:CHASE2 domain-containing sensor protein/predicted Ser/Thr protein kinase